MEVVREKAKGRKERNQRSQKMMTTLILTGKDTNVVKIVGYYAKLNFKIKIKIKIVLNSNIEYPKSDIRFIILKDFLNFFSVKNNEGKPKDIPDVPPPPLPTKKPTNGSGEKTPEPEPEEPAEEPAEEPVEEPENDGGDEGAEPDAETIDEAEETE